MSLELGVSLVARDAPFELRVRRETYDDPIRVWQAFHRPGSVHLEELPADILEGWSGLDRFLHIDLFHRGELINGSYWIEVRANPTGALFDADPSNDVELRQVILGGSPGARTVSVPPWHGIDTEMWFGFGR